MYNITALKHATRGSHCILIAVVSVAAIQGTKHEQARWITWKSCRWGRGPAPRWWPCTSVSGHTAHLFCGNYVEAAVKDLQKIKTEDKIIRVRTEVKRKVNTKREFKKKCVDRNRKCTCNSCRCVTFLKSHWETASHVPWPCDEGLGLAGLHRSLHENAIWHCGEKSYCPHEQHRAGLCDLCSPSNPPTDICTEVH